MALVRTTQSVARVKTAALEIGQEAIRSLKRWWAGEISGKRCAKNIVDSLATIAAGALGGAYGATLGAVAGPVGAVIGGLVGTAVGSSTAAVIVDSLTRTVFDLPKGEALERAYNYFEVSQRSAISELNSAYRQKCSRHHPDKGGDNEEFLKLQSYWGIIKMALGDL